MGSIAIHNYDFNKMRSSVALTQGARATDEDNYTLGKSLPNHQGVLMHAVFDGHGGISASKWLPDILLKHINCCRDPMDQEQLSSAFLAADQELMQTLQNRPGLAASSGTTCTVALTHYTEGKNGDCDELHITIANVGDSPAMVIAGGDVVMKTRDHKPYIEQELLRIRSAGGTVQVRTGWWDEDDDDDNFGSQGVRCADAFKHEPLRSMRDYARLNGVLNMSRCFGDIHFKVNHNTDLQHDPRKLQLTAEPDISTFRWKGSNERPRAPVIVICSDGAVERLTLDKIVQMASEAESLGISPRELARRIVENSIRANTSDNTTALVLTYVNERNFKFAKEYIRSSPATIASVNRTHDRGYNPHISEFYAAYVAHAFRHGHYGLTQESADDVVRVDIRDNLDPRTMRQDPVWVTITLVPRLSDVEVGKDYDD
jgi:serine/threonine protein phosphatase PrpC